MCGKLPRPLGASAVHSNDQASPGSSPAARQNRAKKHRRSSAKSAPSLQDSVATSDASQPHAQHARTIAPMPAPHNDLVSGRHIWPLCFGLLQFHQQRRSTLQNCGFLHGVCLSSSNVLEFASGRLGSLSTTSSCEMPHILVVALSVSKISAFYTR